MARDRVRSRPAGGATSWAEAYESLLDAARRAPLDVEAVEQLAVAAFFVGRDDESLAAWEHAHHLWLRLGDADRAGRCAFWTGLELLLRGEGAPASGWFGRGNRVVAEVGTTCAAAGYLLIPTAMEALGSGSPERALAVYGRIAEIAEECDDGDLHALALLGQGEAAIAAGDAAAGLATLDEVMVAATTGEVGPMTTGIVYCAVIEACVHALDLRRAAQWTDALTRWCEGQPELFPFRGQCLVHRSQVLLARGEWAAALEEAARAEARLAAPPHPAIGIALYQRAELHRLRGEFDLAERAYARASEHGRDPVPGLALLRLAQGRVAAAVAATRRMLGEAHAVHDRLALLPASVEVLVAAGEVPEARAAGDELAMVAAAHDNPYVAGSAAHAAAAVLLAEGRPQEALREARRAQHVWRELGMPYECARSQVLVATACRALGDGDAADLELAGARSSFEQLGAVPDSRRLGAPAPAVEPLPVPLTARECDVLRLVADGMTNRDIGASLTISEHTVARHLQNIFSKLGVSSRAAATAHAYELGVV